MTMGRWDIEHSISITDICDVNCGGSSLMSPAITPSRIRSLILPINFLFVLSFLIKERRGRGISGYMLYIRIRVDS